MRLKRHDSINRIIFEILHNSRTQMAFPRCGRLSVSFLPQLPGFRLIFGQVGRGRRNGATLLPPSRHKYGSVVNAAS
jgi:hypothetical protein